MPINLGWEIGETRTVPCVLGYFKKSYEIKPVRLLEYFENKYHSAGGMYGLIVSTELANWTSLPGKNADWLIVGIRADDEQYIPLVAMSANLSPSSSTMLMGIYTDDDELKGIAEFWNGVRGTKIKLIDAINTIADYQERSQTNKS
jgi:hypothetical protein